MVFIARRTGPAGFMFVMSLFLSVMILRAFLRPMMRATRLRACGRNM